jgi:hypothetical protein
MNRLIKAMRRYRGTALDILMFGTISPIVSYYDLNSGAWIAIAGALCTTGMYLWERYNFPSIRQLRTLRQAYPNKNYNEQISLFREAKQKYWEAILTP